MTGPTPFLTDQESAPSYWQIGALWSVLASARTTGNALTVLDQVMPRRSGPPPHVHERYHEFFYLLDGEIRFQTGTDLRTASAGSLVSIPPGTTHSFAVVSETARALNLYTPGGFEEQIVAAGTPAAALRLPRPGEAPMPGPAARDAVARRAVELLGQSPAGDVPDLLVDERAPLPFSREH